MSSNTNQVVTNNKESEQYQYNEARYHPVEEYLVSSVEKLTSDTPAFVLEVTWPRVVIFYHPASPLCLQLRDRYVATARFVRRRSTRTLVEFWAVSCELHRDSCEELEVTAVPKILAFPAGTTNARVVARTNDNDIKIEQLASLLGLSLEDDTTITGHHDSSLSKEEKLLEQDRAKLEEIDKRAREAKDPILIEGDHMREILHPQNSDLSSDIYADAMTSLLLSIDNTVRIRKDHTWSWDEYRVFREWIDLLHWSLPTRDMANAHNIVNDLRNNIVSIRDRPDEITKILELHNYNTRNSEWSKSCETTTTTTTKVDGYVCGFWNFVHILSIGVYAQHEQVLGDFQRVLVPHVAATIRDYIQHFGFAGNDDGRRILLQAFQDCAEDDDCQKKMGLKNKKKGLLFSQFTFQAAPAKEDKHWKDLAIFLWKIHQTYRTNRLNDNKADSQLGSVDNELLQWPPASDCPMCYSTRGMPDEDTTSDDDTLVIDRSNQIIWNKEPLFNHIKQHYWPHALQTPRVVVLDQWNTKSLLLADGGDSNTELKKNILISSMIISVLVFFFLLVLKQFKIRRIKRRHRNNHRMNSIWLGNTTTKKSTSRRRVQGRSHTTRFRPASRPFLDD